jgi:UDP-N-acetylglucosamine diphosphorylase/glucosamine-1-phosphate N-acetyltransferase
MTPDAAPLHLRFAPPRAGAPLDPGHWVPFLATRPLQDRLHGTRTLGERVARAVARGMAQDPSPPPASPGAARAAAPGDGIALVVDPRFVPDQPLPAEAARALAAGTPSVALLDDEGQVVARSDDAPVRTSTHPTNHGGGDAREGELRLPWPGHLLRSAWDLMHRNPARITRDLLEDPPAGALPLDPPPPGVTLLGSYPITAAPGVEIDPQVVLDARKGPIHLSGGVRVRAFTRLEGPAWIGAGTQLTGGVLSEVSVGPVCRVRGEVECSILDGWCNKAHDGYLGHAVLGRWVNLGALTTNSDLKNTYGTVRVALDAARTEDTGLLKVGVLLGDHVKTGIGTLLNTGTVVGAGSTLFAGGEGLPPRWVPPFSWGSGDTLVPARLHATLEVAERAMARRDEALTPPEREALETLWEATHGKGDAAP